MKCAQCKIMNNDGVRLPVYDHEKLSKHTSNT